jgi:hypothetical protein
VFSVELHMDHDYPRLSISGFFAAGLAIVLALHAAFARWYEGRASLLLAVATLGWFPPLLALPMFVILALQAIGVALFTTFITFRVMGSNYEAAALVAGQCGFGLGATPTAIANMQAVCERYGYAPGRATFSGRSVEGGATGSRQMACSISAADGPFGPGEPWYTPDSHYAGYDPDAAASEVTEYEQQTGQSLSFTLMTFPDDTSVRQAQLLQEMWTKAGAKAFRAHRFFTGAFNGEWLFHIDFDDFAHLQKCRDAVLGTDDQKAIMANNAKAGNKMVAREVLLSLDT